MQINYVGIIAATVAQFACGFLWYGPLFGKLWGKIHGFDKLPRETQQKMMKEITPFYGVQFLVTLVISFVMSLFITNLPADWNPYGLAFFFWLGFTAPAQVGAVIFGGTDKKWIGPKIAIQAGGALLCLEVAAFVLTLLPY